MRVGYAVWNLAWNTPDILDLIAALPGMGFDAASFHPTPLPGMERGLLREIGHTVRRLDLPVTVHGNVLTTDAELELLIDTFGPALANYTIDNVSRLDSRGRLYDAGLMAGRLQVIADLTEGTSVRFGVEDFPLDDLARGFFARDLAPLLDHPRFGVLVDIGHMHLRRRESPYFASRSLAQDFAALPLPLIEVHLHDNDGQKDQHATFGQGNLDLPAYARALRESGFDGICTLEFSPYLSGQDPAAVRASLPEHAAAWRRWWQAA